MKQVILLSDGSKVEIDGNKVKHVNKDGKVLYDSATFLYDQEQIDYLRRSRHDKDINEKVEDIPIKCVAVSVFSSIEHADKATELLNSKMKASLDDKIT